MGMFMNMMLKTYLPFINNQAILILLFPDGLVIYLNYVKSNYF